MCEYDSIAVVVVTLLLERRTSSQGPEDHVSSGRYVPDTFDTVLSVCLSECLLHAGKVHMMQLMVKQDEYRWWYMYSSTVFRLPHGQCRSVSF